MQKKPFTLGMKSSKIEGNKKYQGGENKMKITEKNEKKANQICPSKVGDTTFTGDQRISVHLRDSSNWELVIEKVTFSILILGCL